MLTLSLISCIPLKVTVSNPAEVAKTRLQLQGELAKEGGKKVYKHSLDVFVKTWKKEGIRGMQRGLYPAVSGHSRWPLVWKFYFISLIVCVPSKCRGHITPCYRAILNNPLRYYSTVQD